MSQADTANPATPDGPEPFVIALDPRTEAVRAIVEPAIEDEGCVLVNLHLIQGSKRTTLRLFVDTESEGGISLEQLEKLNRLLGDLLDVEDEHRGLFRGAYNLEVSSPGLDRPLAKRSHFETQVGKRLKVRTRTKIADARSHTGDLVSVDDSGIELASPDGEDGTTIGWRDLAEAHVVYEFEKPPAAKRQNKREKRARRQGNG
jgi:ribosome maturation factor RimP